MTRYCKLVGFYRRYLVDSDLAGFLDRVRHHYSMTTLHRLLHGASSETRRSAVLALGWLGGMESQLELGPHLRDKDRGVRLLTFSLLPEVWLRSSGGHARDAVLRMRWLNGSGQFEAAGELGDELHLGFPMYDEALVQRAMASYGKGRIDSATADLRMVLDRNPFHFEAAIGLGHCYRSIFDQRRALRCYRVAVRICPELQRVRLEAHWLEKEE
jgi:hypothetical protein